MANYLIAVGGTGQHVALAVADFMALAHEVYATPDEFPTVHLILVDADQAAERTGEGWWLPEVLRLRGDLLRRRGAPLDAVERELAASLQLARERSARSLELRAEASLAELSA